MRQSLGPPREKEEQGASQQSAAHSKRMGQNMFQMWHLVLVLSFYLMNNSNIEQGIDCIRKYSTINEKNSFENCHFLELIFPIMCIWTFPPKV